MGVNSISNYHISERQAMSPPFTEAETKSLESQIAKRQSKLDSLSSDTRKTEREKAEEHRELQRQLEELKRRLKMIRMEEELKRKEEKEEYRAALEEEKASGDSKKVSLDEQTDENSAEERKELLEKLEKINISPQDVQKLLEAAAVVQKERMLYGVRQKKEGAENVMETEIALDKMHGSDVTSKEEKLSSLRSKEIFVPEGKEEKERQNTHGLSQQKERQVKIIFRDTDIM